MSVAVVTDSTAYLPQDLVEAAGVHVVPLSVSADGQTYTEGRIEEEALLHLLRRSRTLTTSRPSPQVFHEVYQRLAARGASAVVSVHLSGELSGTCDAATLAGRTADVPVRVVDSRTMGMTLGHAVLTAATAARSGASVDDVADVARRRADAGRLYFYVHTLEHLRRGGRIGHVGALLGSALAVRPLLQVTQGRIDLLEKVRTSNRALARLVEVAGEQARQSPGPVALTVHHLGDAPRAHRLASALAEAVGEQVAGDVRLRPIGAVAATHLGPGAMAVSVSPESV